MKLIDLLRAKPVLEELSRQKMSGKLAYALVKNIRLINIELEMIGVTRDRMLSEHWPVDPEKGEYSVPPEDAGKWHQMYTDFLQTESNLVPYKIPIEWFESLQLSPIDLVSIEWLLKSDDEPESS